MGIFIISNYALMVLRHTSCFLWAVRGGSVGGEGGRLANRRSEVHSGRDSENASIFGEAEQSRGSEGVDLDRCHAQGISSAKHVGDRSPRGVSSDGQHVACRSRAILLGLAWVKIQ
jgi:hypothetical protein